MILVVGSQKGGCGKSTLVVNIAAELSRLGHDPVVVDADYQGTATRWGQNRDESEKDVTPITCIELSGNVHTALLDLDKRYEYVVVDAAGRDSKELRTALTVAHTLITPFRPSQQDIDTLPELVSIISSVEHVNPDLIIKALLSVASTNPFIHEARDAREVLSDYPPFTLCKTLIRDRKAYRDSMAEGLGAVEWKDPKARAEIQLLVQEIIQWQNQK